MAKHEPVAVAFLRAFAIDFAPFSIGCHGTVGDECWLKMKQSQTID